MKIRLFLAVCSMIALSSLLMISCSSSSSSSEENNTNDRMTATISGSISHAFVGAAFACYGNIGSQGSIQINAIETTMGGAMYTMSINLFSVNSGASTIDFPSMLQNVEFTYVTTSPVATRIFKATAGKIVITTNNDTNIAGTFNLTLEDESDATKTITMPNGSFYLKKITLN